MRTEISRIEVYARFTTSDVAQWQAMHPWMIAGPVGLICGAAGLTTYGAVHPRSQLFGPTIRHTDAARKLALTFDDGPNSSITPKLLDLLGRYKAQATFFVIGKFAKNHPDILKEILARGHLIGNHTQTHPNMFFCNRSETRDELLRCTEAIANAMRERPRWFRPPFGFRSPWLVEIALQQGMRTVMWTLLPGDWHAPTPEWLMERLKPIAARFQSAATRTTGDILCLHDGQHRMQNADRTRTLAALEYWLPRWRDLGLEFVTIENGTKHLV